MAQTAPIGARDRRITLQRAVTSRNTLGEPVDAWQDFAKCWAARDDVSGAERVRADAEEGVSTKFFTILWARSWQDLSPKDRLVYAGQIFNIRAVSEIGYHKQLIVEAFAPVDRGRLSTSSPAGSDG